MATVIKLKRSETALAIPSAGSLAAGELALNITDGKFYTKTSGGVVKEVGGAGSVTLQDGNSVTQFQVDVPAGDVFSYNLAEDGILFEGGMTISALSNATVTVILDK